LRIRVDVKCSGRSFPVQAAVISESPRSQDRCTDIRIREKSMARAASMAEVRSGARIRQALARNGQQQIRARFVRAPGRADRTCSTRTTKLPEQGLRAREQSGVAACEPDQRS